MAWKRKSRDRVTSTRLTRKRYAKTTMWEYAVRAIVVLIALYLLRDIRVLDLLG